MEVPLKRIVACGDKLYTKEFAVIPWNESEAMSKRTEIGCNKAE
jgi:hypothetical protein